MTRTEYLFDSLCNNELIYLGLEIKVKKSDLIDAPNFSCREDKWIWLIENKKSIYLVDEEAEEKTEINKEILNNRFISLKNDVFFKELLKDIRDNNGDSISADNFIQYIAFGEVYYG